MKVLITGSSGSLGRMLTEYLISRKIYVAGLDINEGAECFNGEYFRFHKCCITDKARLESIFSEEQPSNVVHFACTFNKIRSRRREYNIDIEGSTNILEVSDCTLSVKQLILSSSAAIYGAHKDNNLWLKESDNLRPGRYRYGINKKLIEKKFFGTPVRSDLHIVSLRTCQVVGPSYDKKGSIVSLLIKLPFIPKFCMENKIQFIHSDDFESLVGHVLEDSDIVGAFNLAPDNFVIIRELVPWKKFIGVPLSITTGLLFILWNLRILNLQPASIKTSIYPMILDPSRLISRYGYRFKFSSEEAFDITLQNNKLP
jgi:UDP-glucose 4-epimerase